MAGTYTVYTEVDILVSRVLKGEMMGRTVRVRTFGGQVDDILYEISGYPTFELDRTYLLFLHPDGGLGRDVGAEHLTVNGAIQGLYEITGDRAILSYRGKILNEFPLEELLNRIREGASWTPIPTITPKPKDLIYRLRAYIGMYVRQGKIDAALQDGLLEHITNVEKNLAEKQARAAIQRLEAFVREVQAQRGQGIEDAAADDLIAQAQAIITALGDAAPLLTPTPTLSENASETPTPAQP